MTGSGQGMVLMASCQEHDPPTCSEGIKDITSSDKMVSILIRFVKLIGHFLLCKTCPVYHRKLIGSRQFGYVSISFNSSDIKAVITLSRSDDLVLNVKSQSPSVYGAAPWHPAVPECPLGSGLTWEVGTLLVAAAPHLWDWEQGEADKLCLKSFKLMNFLTDVSGTSQTGLKVIMVS